MTSYAFVLVTSETCGACHNFLGKYWDFFKTEKLSQYHNIKIVHINISGREFTPICDGSFNPDVMHYIKAYPSFIFMKYDDFLYSPMQMKSEYIYAVDDNYVPLNIPRDITSIGKWVDEKYALLNNEKEVIKSKTNTKVKRQRR